MNYKFAEDDSDDVSERNELLADLLQVNWRNVTAIKILRTPSPEYPNITESGWAIFYN